MQSFFSITDTNTLREEGNKRNHFVSLIVNNAGTYTAGITRKVINSRIIETYTYNSFEGSEQTHTREYDAEDQLEWCELAVDKASVMSTFQELDERLAEIREEKNKKASAASNSTIIKPANNSNAWRRSYNEDVDDFYRDYYKSPSLFNRSNIDDYKLDNFNSKSTFNSSLAIPQKLVDSIVLQLVTGCISIQQGGKIDPVKWMPSMIKLFKDRFETIEKFSAWADMFYEYIMLYPPEQFKDYDETEYAILVSSEVIAKLEALPKNEYITEFIRIIRKWQE